MSRGSMLRRTIQRSRGFRAISKKDKYRLAVNALKAILAEPENYKSIAQAAIIILEGK